MTHGASETRENGRKQVIQSLDRIYAAALLDLAQKAGNVDQILEQVKDVALLLEQQPDLRRLFESQLLSREQRKGSIERLFKPSIDELFYHFLLVINQKDRADQLGGILNGFIHLVDERAGRVDVDAYVAQLLTEPQARQIADSLGKALKKTVNIRQNVDPSLLGGLKIRVGDTLVDASVATQLKVLREKAITAGREKARQLAPSL